MSKRAFFLWLGAFVTKNAPWVVLFFALLVGAALSYIREFPIRSSYLDLLPLGDPLVEKYESVQAELRGLDVAAILLKLENPPEDPAGRARLLFAAADRVIAELDPAVIARASYFLQAQERIPPELLIFRALYPEERERLSVIVAELSAYLSRLAEVQGISLPAELPNDPEELDRVLGALVGAGQSALKLFAEIPEIRDLLVEAGEIVKRAQSRTVPAEAGQPLLSLDHTRLVIQVWPTQPVYASQEFNRRVRDELRRAVAAAEISRLGVTAGFTGGYIHSTEVEDSIRRDMAWVTILSTFLIVLFTLLALGSPILSVLALLPVAISAILTVAWAKFSVNGFNLLTTFLPALVLGLGIDYSLHLFSRFSEARRDGASFAEAVLSAVEAKGVASLVAAATTAAVFCCLLFSRSRALWELGVIMSLGIGISFVSVFTLGPALLVLTGRIFPKLRGRPLLDRERLYRPYRNLLLLRRGVILFSLILTAVALAKAVRVEFKFASGELVPPTSAQAVLQEIVENFGGEIWLGDVFRVFVPDPRELGPLSEKLKAHPLVDSVLSARALLPWELLGEATKLQNIPVSQAKDGLSALSSLLERWPELGSQMEETAALFSLFELRALLLGEARKALVFSKRAEDFFELAEEIKATDPVPIQEALSAMNEALGSLEAFAQKLRALPSEEKLMEQILALLPEEIRSQYRISRGYILEIRVRPALYQGRNLEEFVNWLRGFDVDYVGSPEIQLALEHHMRRDFFFTSGLALFFIFLVVLVDFRKPQRALLSLVPLAMGYAFMLGGMAALRLRFNFTNIVISPLLIGLGVDGAVHFLHRYYEEEEKHEREAAILAAAATTGPTLGSYLTTMASFGALLSAHTPGLRFLGASALLGLGFTTLWMCLFLPALVAELQKTKGGTKVP
jgi:predicted RND superfamily exporter protein